MGAVFVVLGGLSVASSGNDKLRQRDEARMLAEALLDAEVRIGELFKQMPKATKGSGGNRYQSAPARENRTAAEFSKSKTEAISELGFSQDQAERFETLASNPDLVEQVKAEARVLWKCRLFGWHPRPEHAIMSV